MNRIIFVKKPLPDEVAKRLIKKWKRIRTMDISLRDNDWKKVKWIEGANTTRTTDYSKCSQFYIDRINQANRIIESCQNDLLLNAKENETKTTSLE